MALRVPGHLVERIERKLPIAYLARRAGVKLRRQGEELVGHCLFHEEAGPPTLRITPCINHWWCVKCNAGGAAIAWVMRHHGLSRQAAALELLDEFFPGAAAALRSKPVEARRARATREEGARHASNP